MKIVGMIPARLGSKRVKYKNIRIIKNKPLIQYIIDSAKNSKLLNDIFLNSESNIIKEIALSNKVDFYRRSKFLSSDKATNDDFTLDFFNNIDCDILIQMLPTSPFITSDVIDKFISELLKNDYDTLISVTDILIESVYKDKAINFDKKKKTPPSQLLTPIKSYACGLMGWKKENFLSNMSKYNAGYHGGDGKIGYFQMKGLSTVDIDNEEDFELAEIIANNIGSKKREAKYFSAKNNLIYDKNREKILINDGVHNNNMHDYNQEVTSVDEIINQNSKNTSWSHTLVDSKSNSATLIAQMPGEGNRMHFHPDWDEWWYIIQGQWEWIIEGEKKIINKGNHVYIQRNKIHKITAIGEGLSIRMAVSREDVDHVYTEENYK